MAVADKTGSVDHVGLVVEDRLDEARILRGIVLQIGILDEHDIAPGLPEARAQGGALALIERLVDDADILVPLELAENVARAVRAGIVYNNDLFRNWNGRHAPHQLAD